MTKTPKLAIGVFAAIGVLVTLKLVTGTVSISGSSNICNEILRNEYSSPDGTHSITIEHLSCSNTGSRSSVLLGYRDSPNEHAVLLNWEEKTYENDGFVFFPPPVAVQWYSNSEVHIMAPPESLEFKRNEARDGVEVKYYSVEPHTRRST